MGFILETTMEQTPPIAITKLDIQEYRLFKKLEAEIHPSLTVFIAPNSGGKTALLDALGMTLENLAKQRVRSWEEKDIKSSPHLSGKRRGAVTGIAWINLHFKIAQKYLDYESQEIDNIELLTVRNRSWKITPEVVMSWHSWSSKDETTDTFLSKGILKFLSHIHQPHNNDQTLPLFAHFTANRRVGNEVNQSLSTEEYDLDRKQALTSLLPCNNLTNLDKWLRERAITGLEKRLEMEENGEEGSPEPDAHLQAVSKTLATMLEKEVNIKTVKYFSSTKRIQAVKDDGERIDIEQLSHGAKSILLIAAKLTMHCCALNPHLKEEAPLKTPGIVLIDEIDLHLHPKWQQHVIEDFQRCFPAMQFIVTTHSPAVLSTVKKEHIRVIQVDAETGNATASEPSVRSYGESIENTLETIMSVPARPDNELVRRISAYLDWAENGDLDDEQTQEREYLEENLGKSHADLLTADLVIKRRKLLAGL